MNVERRRAHSWLFGARLVCILSLAAVACDNRMHDGSCGSQVAGELKLGVWWGSSPQMVAQSSASGAAVGSTNASSSDVDRPPNAEARALDQLIVEYTDCNEFVEPKKEPYNNKAELTAALDALPDNPSPEQLDALPDVVQLNAGETAFRYAPCLGRESTILAPISADLWKPGTWETKPDRKVADSNGRTPNNRRLADGAVWYEKREHTYQTYANQNERPTTELKDWIYEDVERWIKPFITRAPDAACSDASASKTLVAHASPAGNVKSLVTSSGSAASGDGPPSIANSFDEFAEGRLMRVEPSPYWMAPIAVHHLNRLYVNIDLAKDLLGQQDVSDHFEKLTLEAWLNELQVWSSKPGVPLLALPKTRESAWALSLLAAENLKIAYTKGPASRPDATAREVASQVMKAMDVLVRVSQESPWTVADAMDAVAKGRAVFTVMGDWSYPDVKDDGKVLMVPFPGTHNVLVYTIDGFVGLNKRRLPGVDGATEQAKAWMKAISDEAVAEDFAATKGAVSIYDWFKKTVLECAAKAAGKDSEEKEVDASGVPLDCMVVPALSMSGTGCDGAAVFSDWLADPSDANRTRVETSLATGECLPPPPPPTPPPSPGSGANLR